VKPCESLDEVRAGIDRIDSELVQLLAERGELVRQAAHFKRSADEVRAPKRVEAVIQKVTGLATELGACPVVIERVYRAMIAAFIDAELNEHENTEKS